MQKIAGEGARATCDTTRLKELRTALVHDEIALSPAPPAAVAVSSQ